MTAPEPTGRDWRGEILAVVTIGDYTVGHRHPKAAGDWSDTLAEHLIDALGLRELEQAAAERRCWSCDHGLDMHQPEGCWYTVDQGTPARDSVCPCTVARAAASEVAR